MSDTLARAGAVKNQAQAKKEKKTGGGTSSGTDVEGGSEAMDVVSVEHPTPKRQSNRTNKGGKSPTDYSELGGSAHAGRASGGKEKEDGGDETQEKRSVKFAGTEQQGSGDSQSQSHPLQQTKGNLAEQESTGELRPGEAFDVLNSEQTGQAPVAAPSTESSTNSNQLPEEFTREEQLMMSDPNIQSVFSKYLRAMMVQQQQEFLQEQERQREERVRQEQQRFRQEQERQREERARQEQQDQDERDRRKQERARQMELELQRKEGRERQEEKSREKEQVRQGDKGSGQGHPRSRSPQDNSSDTSEKSQEPASEDRSHAKGKHASGGTDKHALVATGKHASPKSPEVSGHQSSLERAATPARKAKVSEPSEGRGPRHRASSVKLSPHPKVSGREILSLLTQCPRCSKSNAKIPGDPLEHYLTCTKNNNPTPATHELVALAEIKRIQRALRPLPTNREVKKVRRDEREAMRKGDRDLGSQDSSRSPSSEEGVQRDANGYSEEDEEDEEESQEVVTSESEYIASDSSSSSEVANSPSPPPKKKSIKKDGSGLKQAEPEKTEIQALRKQVEQQLFAQEDLRLTVKASLKQIQLLAESVARSTSQPSHLQPVVPFSSPASMPPSMQLGLRPAAQGGGGEYQDDHQPGRGDRGEQYDTRGRQDDPGDQNFPEIEDKNLAIASAFEEHKRAFKTYVSKARKNNMRAVSLAYTFKRWARWFAVVFTEQDKLRSETSGNGIYTFYTEASVLAMSDDAFEMCYLELCGLSIQTPSQVLDFLKEVEVDVSTGNISSIMAASESFQKKLQQIPTRALHLTTTEWIRNAYLESLFGEEMAKKKRVNYASQETWEDVVTALSKAASRSPMGVAFEPFTAVLTHQKKDKKGKKRSDFGPEDSPASITEEERADRALQEGCNMQLMSEKKWFKRYCYFARQNKLPLERHGGSKSWRTRYVYIMDECDKKSGRCSLCKQRGHLASKCEDPLPDVIYPDLDKPKHDRRQEDRRDRRSEDRSGRSEDRPYDRGRDGGRSYRDSSRPRDSSRGRDSPRPGGAYAPTNERAREPSREGDRYQRDRDQSGDRHQRDREQTLGRSRDGERRDDRQVDRAGSSPRPPSREGSRERKVTCYRCGFEGHLSRDCTAVKDRDGRTLSDK
jgi:hypothetical protein